MQTACFSLIHSLWSMAPLSGTHTKRTIVIELMVQHRVTRFVKSRCPRLYVSDMLDDLGWPSLSQITHSIWILC